jgi:hypothetical protein
MTLITLLGLLLGLFSPGIFQNIMAEIQALVKTWGYPGVFVISLLNSLAIIYSLLGFATFVLIAYLGTVLNPWLVGLLAGLAVVIGQFTSYYYGYTGEFIVKDVKDMGINKRVSNWIHGLSAKNRWTDRVYTSGSQIFSNAIRQINTWNNRVFAGLKNLIKKQAGFIIWFIYFTGLPFGDITGIAVGGLAESLENPRAKASLTKKYFLYCALGNIPRHILYALYGLQFMAIFSQSEVLIPTVAGISGTIELLSIVVLKRHAISKTFSSVLRTLITTFSGVVRWLRFIQLASTSNKKGVPLERFIKAIREGLKERKDIIDSIIKDMEALDGAGKASRLEKMIRALKVVARSI